MDPRFEKINELFINYSKGKFGYKLELSEKLDEIDAFISSINMLGEELKETTISKNYFNNIFNSVSDNLFVLNKDGIIEKVNQVVANNIEGENYEIQNQHIDTIISLTGKKSFFRYIKNHISTTGIPIEQESTLTYSKNNKITTQSTSMYLYNDKQEILGYLVRAKDLSNIKKIENSLKQSEEKYRKIFEETNDCIFIINIKGDFIDLNKAGLKLFQLSQKKLPNANYFNYFNLIDDKKYFLNQLSKKKIIDYNTKLKVGKLSIDCLISASKIIDENNCFIGYQGIVKNITQQKETENLIIRTIIDTQEQERIRFAKDIHDSLGQQLSAIKFYLATLSQSSKAFQANSLLSKSNNALTSVLEDMRNICFNLMPKTLESFGLLTAVNELCRKNEFAGLLNFRLVSDYDFPTLNKSLEIAVFRIIQEFINNSIKHGNAKNIDLSFKRKKEICEIILKDDGVGFDTQNIHNYPGMGLKNVLSRIKSHEAEIKIMSQINNGTTYKISIAFKIPASKHLKNKKILNII